ncbi:MAG: enoyl-CoA hydratase/isomerase family protein [Deltaproteobacteria bacterium]|nr:enoyl-CoA hydratase/isomerase family protein [Deltaproteobacteria bacterium]
MINLDFDKGIYRLALERRPLNEIGTEMLDELERALTEIDTEKAQALVIYSALERGFCAGADLRELYSGILTTPEELQAGAMRAFLDRIHQMMDRLDTLPLTTIGAIHGICFGGGFELALTCDVLVADQTARFGFPELRLGIIPCFGGIPRLKREAPNSVVRDLLLTGRSINAKKAASLGLISQLVKRGEALSVAEKVAEQAGRFDRRAAITAKGFIKRLPRQDLELEKEHFLSLFSRPVVKDCLRRFVQSDDRMPYLPQGLDEPR